MRARTKGDLMYKVDHDIDSRGLHHWMVRRVRYDSSLDEEIGKTVFDNLVDIWDLIEKTDKEAAKKA